MLLTVGVAVKFVFLYRKPSLAGVGVVTIRLLDYLCKSGHQVVLAVDHLNDSAFGKRLPQGVQVIQRQDQESPVSFSRRLLIERADIYIGVQSHNTYWLVLGKWLTGIQAPIVSWEHTAPVVAMTSEYPRLWPLHVVVKKLFSLFTDAFFCVSNGVCEELQNRLKIGNDKVFYVPNLVYASADVKKLPGRQTVPGSGPVFISVGRLSLEKGLDLALDALEHLENTDWAYWIVGEGPERESLQARCKSTPALDGNVRFWGWQDDPASLMVQADALLLPSYYEGMPTVLIEASLYELPLIAADCNTGPREIIRDGYNGYLFRVGDASDLLDRIKRFVGSPGLLKNNFMNVKQFSDEVAGATFSLAVTAVVDAMHKPSS